MNKFFFEILTKVSITSISTLLQNIFKKVIQVIKEINIKKKSQNGTPTTKTEKMHKKNVIHTPVFSITSEIYYEKTYDDNF